MQRIQLTTSHDSILTIFINHIVGYQSTEHGLTALYTTGGELFVVRQTPEEIDFKINNP